jgi:ribosome recycling factor
MADEEILKELLHDTEGRMQKAVEATRHDLTSVRTGRANPALVEKLEVDAYGSRMPVMQMGSVTAPEPRLLVISPWDKTVIPAIERAIRKSDLGLNPSTDGNLIRIPIPALTEETRKNLIRVVHRRVEEGKVAVRNVRRDAIESLRHWKKDGDIGEDEEKRAEEQVQKLADRYVEGHDALQKAKEHDLMEV